MKFKSQSLVNKFMGIAISIMFIMSCFILCGQFSIHADDTDVSTVEPADLEFSPVGGGKFIYCNNTEGITRETLADPSNPNPRYTMTNENLTPNKYYVYLSHINYTYGHDDYYNPQGLGFDVELDLEIKAKEDSTLVINNAACEVAKVQKCSDADGEFYYTSNWGGLNACATMLNHSIKEFHSYKTFNSYGFSPITINIKKGDTVWLSQYLKNYRACPLVMPIFMVADTELKSGMVDMNVVELKSKDGKLGDRSDFDGSKVAFGSYYRDRCLKGVADSLPQVDADVSYTIDNTTKNGEYLPVTLKNQYVPEGVTLNEWVTNLNPQDDIWAKYITAESDMLAFKYYDPKKSTYYGKNIPVNKRDNYWIFDTTHSDTKDYVSESGVSQDDYEPNYKLTTDKDNYGVGCSMGNYGVSERYNITIKNNGSKTRYFTYDATTSANIIVALRNADGSFSDEQETPVICKGGNTWDITTDTCAYVKLNPGETKSFIVETLLPVNYLGGLKNAFRIVDTKPSFSFENKTIKYLEGSKTIANSYMDEYQSLANDETKEYFSGNLNNFEITPTDYGYMLRWMQWDDHPDWQGQFKSLTSNIYFLNKSFDLVGIKNFDSFPCKAIYSHGKFIVTSQDGSRHFSTDGATWYTPYWDKSEDETMDDVMVKLDNEYIKFDQKPIIIDDRTLVPMRFIFEKFGMEVEWNDETQTATATKGSKKISFTIGSNKAVIDGVEYGLDTNSIELNGRTLIPLRFLSESMGYIVTWNEYAQEVIINSLPELPKHTQKDYVIYKEGYRDNRIEVVFFDTTSKSLIWNQSITPKDGVVSNDVKYYYDEPTNSWIEFEKGYGTISNSASAILDTNMEYSYTKQETATATPVSE